MHMLEEGGPDQRVRSDHPEPRIRILFQLDHRTDNVGSTGREARARLCIVFWDYRSLEQEKEKGEREKGRAGDNKKKKERKRRSVWEKVHARKSPSPHPFSPVMRQKTSCPLIYSRNKDPPLSCGNILARLFASTF